MKTLEELQKEFGYPILTNEEVRAIREHTVNWNSLEGEIIIRKMNKSYPAYVQGSNFDYKMTSYHYSLTANLQRCYEKGPNPGQAYGLILLSASPQTGKSLSITESFQSWLLIQKRHVGVLTIGYEATFTSRFGRRNREKFSTWAPILSHGRLKLHDHIQSTETWETMELDIHSGLWNATGSGMNTAGIGGPLTGKTGNYIVIDDPIKSMKEADSEVKIADNVEYYQSAIETRMLANPGSMCILMATRWVVGDLNGWLRKHRKKYIVGDFNYAAKCTERNQSKDPLGREIGEGICPEMGLDGAWADEIEESYNASEGAHVFNALFQGEPSDEQGNLFRTEDWGEYEIDKVWQPDTFDRIYMSIDASFKDNDTNDFVAIKIGGIRGGNDYARYVVRKRMDLPDTLEKIIEKLRQFPEIDVIYIEDKANGPGIISVLRKWRRKLNISEREFPSIYPIEPEGGKYSRAQAASPYQREGRCYIPCERDADRFSSPDDFQWDDGELSYTNCFKHELGTFPYGVHDDLVDAHSQQIIKCMALLDGIEQSEKKPRRFTRYSNWWPEMERDYKALKTREEKDEFIRIHGANIKWKPKSEGGTFGVI